MMQDVVVVTISYRVGPLGFLLLKDPAVGVPGNAGLKDQLLGLRWIHANAASFNADPNNVTAFGESAGAASVHYLMLNPKAEGLFHKAILQSGNVLCTWAQCPINDMPQRLAGNLGMENVNDATDAMILDYLQALPGEQLVKPYLLSRAEHMDDCVFQFGPMVEPYRTDHCVLAKQPSELLATAWGNKIPLLMSGTSFEGLLMYGRVFVAPYLLTDLKDQPEHMLPLHLKRTLPLAVAQNLGKRLQATHFGESAAIDLSPAGVLAYCEYATYKVFWLPIMRVVRSRLRHSMAPTYLCRFDFDSPTFNHQRIKYVGDKLRGVAHVDDHSYLWFGSFAWKLDKHTTEFQTIERMIDIVTSFARSSSPNCPKVAEQLPRTKEWLPLDSRQSNVECLNVSESIKLIELPELQKLRVWESVCQIKD
ncbi:esterase B1 isoform X2 [Drosophila obscura]|nr:esterase B1 isoform X2 [Drosophila obscura]